VIKKSRKLGESFFEILKGEKHEAILVFGKNREDLLNDLGREVLVEDGDELRKFIEVHDSVLIKIEQLKTLDDIDMSHPDLVFELLHPKESIWRDRNLGWKGNS